MKRVHPHLLPAALGAVGLLHSACAGIVGADFDGLHPRGGGDAGARSSGASGNGSRDDPSDAGSGGDGAAPPETGTPEAAPPGLPNINSIKVLTPSPNLNLFGAAVAVEDGTALISAVNPAWTGSVYVAVDTGFGNYTRVEGVELTAGPDRREAAFFGAHIAMLGEVAFIGAPGNGLKAPPGATYVFRRTGGQWKLGEKIQATVPDPLDRFGSQSVLDGEIAVVGAPGAGGNTATVPGTVYVFRRSTSGTYEPVQTLEDPAAHAGDNFGAELALFGDTLVVSAFGDDETGHDAGAAYVYSSKGGAFEQVQKLVPTVPVPYWMGWGTMAVGDGVLVVPAVGAEHGGNVYVYARNEAGAWVDEPLEVPEGVTETWGFGWRAAIRGRTLVLAVRNSDEGFALIYRREAGRWKFERKLWPDSADPDLFGYTVAFDGETAAFGAVNYMNKDGAVYFFLIPP